MTAEAAFAALTEDVRAAMAECHEHGLPDHVVADGQRYATELMRMALEVYLYARDPEHPRLVDIITPTMRFAFDNPYTTYRVAPVSGRNSYRLFGNRGASIYLGISVYGGGDEAGGSMPEVVVGSINDTEIPVDADGSWQVLLAPEPPAGYDGAFLRLDPDASSLWIRQYVSDPAHQPQATATIELLDGPVLPDPLTGEKLADQLSRARTFFATLWGINRYFMGRLDERPFNEFTPAQPGGLTQEGRPSGYMYPTKDNLYTFGWYRLAPDEALVVDIRPVPCRYWSFYLGTVWQQAQPYASNHGLITGDNATFNDDGSVTIVVAEDDPGVPNWLPTMGYETGAMGIRYLLREADPEMPATRVVRIADLGRSR